MNQNQHSKRKWGRGASWPVCRAWHCGLDNIGCPSSLLGCLLPQSQCPSKHLSWLVWWSGRMAKDTLGRHSRTESDPCRCARLHELGKLRVQPSTHCRLALWTTTKSQLEGGRSPRVKWKPWVPSPHPWDQAWCCAPVTPALERWRQEDQMVKVTLSSVVTSRPTWPI